MRLAARIMSFVIGLAIFVWLYQHAGGFHPDGTPVDPNPPHFGLLMAATFTAVVLWLYAFAVFQVFGGGGPKT